VHPVIFKNNIMNTCVEEKKKYNGLYLNLIEEKKISIGGAIFKNVRYFEIVETFYEKP
jgi:hypothetical protein